MRLRRDLVPGPDGTAEIVLLTNPIPRHVSLVQWGANDAVATSWMSADFKTYHHVLRSPPVGNAVDPLKVNSASLRALISETLTAWSSCVDWVLASALQPADRASQIRSITIQAGARIAAASVLLGQAATRAASSHKSAGLKLPVIPTSPTLAGEIARQAIKAATVEVSAYLSDAVLESLRLGAGTDEILGIFSSVADAFSSAALASPAGVVGVSNMHHTHLETGIMTITLASLEALAQEDPIKFLEVIRSAVTLAKTKGDAGVSIAKKFSWGETGVEPNDPGKILAEISGWQNGDAITSAIANAISGIDVNKAVGQGVGVASSMRSALARFVTSELTTNPDGELAIAVKGLVAPDVAEAVVTSLKALMDSGHISRGTNGNSALLNFQTGEGDDLSLAADIPELASRGR